MDTVSKTNLVSCGCNHIASIFKNTFQRFSCILSLFLLFNSLVNHSVTVGNNSIQNKLKQDFENKIHTNATCVLHVFPTVSMVNSHTLSCTHINYHLLPIYLSDFFSLLIFLLFVSIYTDINFVLKVQQPQAGEMVQQLTPCTIPAENMSSILSIYIRHPTVIFNSSSSASNTSGLLYSQAPLLICESPFKNTHTHTCTHN